MSWADKIEVKKGDIGEDLIREFLEGQQFILYRPVTDGAHKIDYFAHSGKQKKVICCEVKTKRRMAKHASTGFNITCYNHYIELLNKYNIDTFVFFVDDFEGCVYGQWLSILGEGTIIKNVIVWPLINMKKIKDLDIDIIHKLSEVTTLRYDYSQVKKHF